MRAGILLAGLILAAAAGLRIPRLAQRPMHADEAILADKFGTLLESHSWKYDPREYHGPVLLYLTLIPARLAGLRRYADLTETTLRIVPVLVGLLLVAAPLALARGLGRNQVLAASALTATSPAMVYYSRYYIPEMLLTCWTAGLIVAGHHYARTKRAAWGLCGGLFLGLMLATKETALIAAGSMLVALLLTGTRRLPDWRHLLAALAVALALLAVLVGLPETLQAWRNYYHRGFEEQRHVHAWNYYLRLLTWSDGPILVLAAVGFAAAITGKGIGEADGAFIRFLGVYSLAMATAYSLIPYKTPWCLLGFLHGMILLAGVGIVALARIGLGTVRRLALTAVAAGGAYLLYQACAASYLYDADPRNPYAYAHTTRDVYAIRDRLEGLAGAHPKGRSMPVQVVSSQNLWPLPWYLRSFSRIDWHRTVTSEMHPAEVILASPDLEPALIRALYELPPPGERELYMNMFPRKIELRPGVELRGYVRRSLWEAALLK